MRNFYVITNREKDIELRLTRQVEAFLTERGFCCRLASAYCAEQPERMEEIPPDTDCVLVLGGDGTLLHAARALAGRNIPLLGMNLGTLGFLTEIEPQELQHALTSVTQGDYREERRMMLSAECGGKRRLALNDVVIARRGFSRVVCLSVFVNGQLINRFRCDGVIIATPTGSTAYNLSAGGPIVTPEARLLLITPICAHGFGTRSVIASAEDVIAVEVCRERNTQEEEASVTVDGLCVAELHEGERVVVQCAPETTRLLKVGGAGFFQVLHTKII